VTDICDRCRRGPDPDLRTLWHACFYAMDELGLPFEQCKVQGVYLSHTGTLDAFGYPVFEEPDPAQKPHDFKFFTLRVCKDCRAAWMSAIKAWFYAVPALAHENPEANIPYRENGTTVMLTESEYRAKNTR
jgi:hypothetical protein